MIYTFSSSQLLLDGRKILLWFFLKFSESEKEHDPFSKYTV